MAQIETKEEAVLVHRKNGEVVAVTLSNGHHTPYKLDGSMTRAELKEFYESDQKEAHGGE